MNNFSNYGRNFVNILMFIMGFYFLILIVKAVTINQNSIIILDQNIHLIPAGIITLFLLLIGAGRTYEIKACLLLTIACFLINAIFEGAYGFGWVIGSIIFLVFFLLHLIGHHFYILLLLPLIENLFRGFKNTNYHKYNNYSNNPNYPYLPPNQNYNPPNHNRWTRP